MGYYTLEFHSKFRVLLQKTKEEFNSSAELSYKFIINYARKEKDSNIYYRLFESLIETGIDANELFQSAKNKIIVNIKDKLDNPIVNNLNDCVEKCLKDENF